MKFTILACFERGFVMELRLFDKGLLNTLLLLSALDKRSCHLSAVKSAGLEGGYQYNKWQDRGLLTESK